LPAWLLTLTPAALRSEAFAWRGKGWRLVEAQHVVSTMKLVDTLSEQTVLEDLIDASKPSVPPDCRHLHYLLSTPFRYGAPYPNGSRFRRAGIGDGVFYAAAELHTSLAEMAFYRLLFYRESPATEPPRDAADYTAIAVKIATKAAIDLTRGMFAASADVWLHPTEYGPCQALALVAREAQVDLIQYASVRDPDRRPNLAVLACRAFAASKPVETQSWKLKVGRAGVQAFCSFPTASIEFPVAAFAGDPRIGR
jgi:hypothetical protein